MKLSEIKGDQCIDVLADLIEPMAKMTEDENVLAFFKPREGQDAKEALVDRFRKYAPAVVKNHKQEWIDIMCAISQKPKAEFVKDMTFASLLKDVFDLITDKEFIDLF